MARRITYKGKSKVIIRLCELVNELFERVVGDMLKETYDQNDNGIVDNSERVNGHEVHADVPADAKFTDTVYDDSFIRDRVSYLMNNTELIMTTLFRSEYAYLIDSEGYVIVDADGYPIYTAKFYDMLAELRENVAELREIVDYLKAQKYVVWANPANEETQNGEGE